MDFNKFYWEEKRKDIMEKVLFFFQRDINKNPDIFVQSLYSLVHIHLIDLAKRGDWEMSSQFSKAMVKTQSEVFLLLSEKMGFDGTPVIESMEAYFNELRRRNRERE